jgi:hypothetical protein
MLEGPWPGRLKGLRKNSEPSRSSDLQLVIQFCLIGALVTVILMLLFPGLGALIAEYNQF